ncbi:MAG: energy transducer TonB [Candidatus Sulfotelmatobacter sp.]|jgi:TonB family protein
MTSRILFALFVLAPMLMCGHVPAMAQDSSQSSEGVRKVVTRVTPQYPSLARSMNLRGTVKMVVQVEPNGSPKSMQVRGGNPVLVQAAEKALHEWKWEPATHATSEAVDLRFDPR